MSADPITTASFALSLLNAGLLIWLGLTVLLNAQRRSPGAWLASIGTVIGAVVLLSHAAMAAEGPETLAWAVNGFWLLGWAAAVFHPLAWQVVVLWQAGVLAAEAPGQTRSRHAAGLALGLLCAAFLLAVGAVLLHPGIAIGPFRRLAAGRYAATTGPITADLVYGIFALVTMGHAFVALLSPAPAEDPWRERARRRARPWMLGTTACMLLAGIGVAVTMGLFSGEVWVGAGHTVLHEAPTPVAVAQADVIIMGLITLAVVCLCEAVVAYEIFTGRTLPRQSLRRQWHWALLFIAAYVAMLSALEARDPYEETAHWPGLVLIAGLLAVSTIKLPAGRTPKTQPALGQGNAEAGIAESLRTLCDDAIGAEYVALDPLGRHAGLLGRRCVHPPDAKPPDVVAEVGHDAHWLPAGAWVVPLGNEAEPIGTLVIGPKKDGGLYSHEDIEEARGAAERLLESAATMALAQRLVTLEQRRMAESQVHDRRMRRAIHDEILPELHAAMMALSADGDTGAVERLTAAHRQLSELLREMPGLPPHVERLGLFGALREELDSAFGGAFDAVQWHIPEAAEERGKSLPPAVCEVLFHAAREAIRNAAVHGRGGQENRRLELIVGAAADEGVEVRVEDTGVGLDATPREPEGQGLLLHSTLMALIGGEMAVGLRDEGGTKVVLRWREPH